jgi:pimeloyl-ACP methyl ester carboxylesterase
MLHAMLKSDLSAQRHVRVALLAIAMLASVGTEVRAVEPPAAAPETEGTAAPAPPAAPLDDRWVGAWMGEVRSVPAPGAPTLEMAVTVVVRTAEGASTPTVLVTALRAGAVNTPAVEVEANGRALAFTLDSAGERARFEGTVAEDGRSIAGSFRTLSARLARDLPVFDWTPRRVDLVSELDAARVYAATLEIAGQSLPMKLSIGEGPNGWCSSVDIAQQGILDLPTPIERTESRVVVRIPAGSVATLDLAPSDDGRVLEGTFAQGMLRAPIRFELVEGARPSTGRRPQDPVPPFPYEEREVRIAHPVGHVLAGTLTIPEERSLAIDGLVPAVVLVSGSGPQDRDEAIMGHRPFRVIADALARAGFAVLRYDDRGVAKSTGVFAEATSIGLASDADMASEWLKRQDGIDPRRVGMIGHSEGGLIAPLVAAWQNAGDSPVNPLAFVVSLAGPGETGASLLTRQTRAIYEAAGLDRERLEAAVAAHAELMAAVVARRSPEELRPLVAELVRRQVALKDGTVPEEGELRPTIDAAFLQILNPWMTEFIRYDPRPALEVLEVPTLAMWGDKDLQVDAAVNAAIFEGVAARTGAPITVRRYEGLNHLFQPAARGVIEEYGEIDTTFDPAALADLVAWLRETAAASPVAQTPDASRPAGWSAPYVPPRLFEYREAQGAAP